MIRIGNASGFYGDRFSAMREMLTGGPLDVLTGDYLAELTMLILARDRAKDPGLGYAKSFLRQMEESLGTALARGVKIVTNAGGVNPAGLAARLRELAESMGLDARVGHVEGDDLTRRAGELVRGPKAARSWRSRAGGGPRSRDVVGAPLAAHAYLGAWGIAECLRAGADVVVTGRVTDASLVVGPAAAHFGWARDDYAALAGAVVAGHVIECGAQATGGNYAFFTEHDVHDVCYPGFPIAEVQEDGSSVITKHDGTGGAVTVGTVTAQLLYEITGSRYLGPDVTARMDTVELSQVGADRVLISKVRGEAPPPTYKVSLSGVGGFRNEVTFVLTGLDIEAKAGLAREQVERSLARRPAELRWTLARTDRADAGSEEEASALLHCVAEDADPAVVGRAFSEVAVQLALASYPGFHLTAPPGDASPYGVFTPGYVDATAVPHVAVLPDGSRVDIAPAAPTVPTVPTTNDHRKVCKPVRPSVPNSARLGGHLAEANGHSDRVVVNTANLGGQFTSAAPAADPREPAPLKTPDAPGTPGTPDVLDTPDALGVLDTPDALGVLGVLDTPDAPDAPGIPDVPEPLPPGPTRRCPLGAVAGARSGDKGGDANVGVWVRSEAAWRWLANTLTVSEFRRMLPETAGLPVTRHLLPNLRALNFVVEGMLGAGVASRFRFDPQAKAVGEWLRSRHIDIPAVLL